MRLLMYIVISTNFEILSEVPKSQGEDCCRVHRSKATKSFIYLKEFSRSEKQQKSKDSGQEKLQKGS
jgi:hypothetical protein